MDSETIDIYVSATLDEPWDALREALRRLARAWSGPYRPAPAIVIDRCYEVVREQREREAPRQLALPEPLPASDRLDIWDRCLAAAVSEGAARFYRRGLERRRSR